MPKNKAGVLLSVLLAAAGCARDSAVRVRLDVPSPAAVKLADYKTILLPGFFPENEVKEFDAGAVLARFFADELKLKFKGSIEERPASWPGAEALADPEFWKSIAGAAPQTLIVSGRIRYARESRKSLQDVERRPVDDGPFRPPDALMSYRAFVVQIELLLVDGATGRVLFQKTEQDTVMTQNARQTSEYAFYDLLGRLRTRLLRTVIGSDQPRERYLLSK